MEVTDNEGGGQTVVLVAGDSLRAVPRSHRKLVTDDIRKVFKDAPGYFARIAERTPFPRMADWLQALVWENVWQLELNLTYDKKYGRAGFSWFSDTVRGAEIGLPDATQTGGPEPLATLFELVGYVDWSGFCVGGGMIHQPDDLLQLRGDWAGHEVIGTGQTLCWGGFNGAMLFATADGRAGWVSVGGRVQLGGTVAEMIDWWFGMLLAKRIPTMDNFEARPGPERGLS